MRIVDEGLTGLRLTPGLFATLPLPPLNPAKAKCEERAKGGPPTHHHHRWHTGTLQRAPTLRILVLVAASTANYSVLFLCADSTRHESFAATQRANGFPMRAVVADRFVAMLGHKDFGFVSRCFIAAKHRKMATAR